jgi:hypothetical protein
MTTNIDIDRNIIVDRKARAANTGLAKVAVQCSADSFVITQTLVFQIKFCGKSPALRVAAKR